MPFFDSIMGMLGSPDPLDEMKDYQKRQNAANNAAAGPSAVIPPGGGGPPGAPGAPGAPGPNAPPPVSTLPPGQEPQGTKTPEDMGSIIIDLTRREQAKQGFNQALGMGFGAFAQPRDREAVDKMFNVAPIDATKLGEGLMQINSQQQGQNRMNTILGLANDPPRLQAAATALHMDPNLLAQLIKTDPQKAADLIQNASTPTDDLKNLGQLDYYTNQVSSMPGHNDKDLATLATAIKSKIAGPEAMKMVFDQINYRNSHKGQDAPWANNIAAYNQHLADDATLSKNIDEASGDVAAHSSKIETLRNKISGLGNDADLARVLAMPQDSIEKQAIGRALGDSSQDWRKNLTDAVLINDPGAMRILSELKEINGQEYANSLDSLMGHGLRPSQTEVGAVREGMGQTKNILNFGSIKDYKAQAIDPMLTRLDEAEATAYGAANAYDAMPARLRPFVHKVYLPGGARNKENSGSEGWAGEVHKQMSPEEEADLANKIKQEPGNAFWYRDQKRRAGYDVNV
jgi:hypothetical protein